MLRFTALQWIIMIPVYSVLRNAEPALGVPTENLSVCEYGMYRNGSFGCVNCDCFRPGTSIPLGKITALNIDYDGVLPCDAFSGQCKCYGEHTGRACDQCAPLTFNDTSGVAGGPLGRCMLCNCEREASTNDTCDAVTGQCTCRNTNIFGRTCDMCRKGFCSHPLCEPCENVVAAALSAAYPAVLNATLNIFRGFYFTMARGYFA
ncbi:laminin subunit beta-4-like [Paramacrobiotus metropolitanus]|uniref:laminin subunit beta-4-like n=1 Tax=Paramacrobiotus metropolitanus TaxID=2943436 RepID=UPI00244573F2|nr:laminin subunit beta-4-like [Paramacrobiotus metropolitanus]